MQITKKDRIVSFEMFIVSLVLFHCCNESGPLRATSLLTASLLSLFKVQMINTFIKINTK